ncbi:hypothetical protein [Niastella caeni]|nr:hypothetical protein [Niastella caeni]
MKIAAKVVALYGDTYIPTFDRLYQEFKKAKSQESKKMQALKIAMEYRPR